MKVTKVLRSLVSWVLWLIPVGLGAAIVFLLLGAVLVGLDTRNPAVFKEGGALEAIVTNPDAVQQMPLSDLVPEGALFCVMNEYSNSGDFFRWNGLVLDFKYVTGELESLMMVVSDNAVLDFGELKLHRDLQTRSQQDGCWRRDGHHLAITKEGEVFYFEVAENSP